MPAKIVTEPGPEPVTGTRSHKKLYKSTLRCRDQAQPVARQREPRDHHDDDSLQGPPDHHDERLQKRHPLTSHPRQLPVCLPATLIIREG